MRAALGSPSAATADSSGAAAADGGGAAAADGSIPAPANGGAPAPATSAAPPFNGNSAPPADEALHEAVRAVFGQYDADLSGGIDVSELHAMLTTLGLDVGTACASRLLEMYDDYPDQRIDMHEFVALARDIRCAKRANPRHGRAVAHVTTTPTPPPPRHRRESLHQSAAALRRRRRRRPRHLRAYQGPR